jgi:hypothetical protein
VTGTIVKIFEPHEAFVLPLPDGLRGEDLPRSFVGVLDHVDAAGRLHVIVSGPVPNDFSRSVFRRERTS